MGMMMRVNARSKCKVLVVLGPTATTPEIKLHACLSESQESQAYQASITTVASRISDETAFLTPIRLSFAM